MFTEYGIFVRDRYFRIQYEGELPRRLIEQSTIVVKLGGPVKVIKDMHNLDGPNTPDSVTQVFLYVLKQMEGCKLRGLTDVQEYLNIALIP